MNSLRFDRVLPTILVALCIQGDAYAQPAPFDMSPELPPAVESLPELPRPNRVSPQPPPRQQEQPKPPSVQTQQPSVSSAPPQAPPHEVSEPKASQQPPSPTQPPGTAGFRRHIIPAQRLSLTGEFNRSAWSVYLTAAQATEGQAISLAYQSAIVVAPETSSFTLFINNRRIGEERINAANGPKSVRWLVPADLLRPGSNDFEIVATQRHRTDCDVQSTYDLWTEIDSGGTFLEFADDLAPPASVMEAVRALGADQQGRTHFEMLVPSIGPMEGLAPLLRLSQGLAVVSSMPNPQFSFVQEIPRTEASPGRLVVAVGTATELRTVLPSLPPGADAGPVSAVTTLQDGIAPLVIITGPSWDAIGSAIESFIAPIVRSPALRRDSMTTDRWERPNAPFVFGGETLSFAQLGIQTAEFSGRRFRTGFSVAVPSDFYAGAYGEAEILLDAAYSASVAGGSHIDIYVNGNIASTIPITRRGGGIFRQEPIGVTMRHFKPGTNRVEIEAVLLTDADAACVPGTVSSPEARFALFDSSTFSMPRYARIGQTPNLAGLSGTGFPYSRQQEPAAFFMDRVDADMLSVAANFLGKTAQVSGAPIDLAPVSAANAVGGRNAIYIGTAGQLPPNVLSQLNLDPGLAASWRPTDSAPQAGDDTAEALEAWRGRLQGGFVSQQLANFSDWVQAKLDLSEGTLRLLPGTETIFRPHTQDDLLLAQGPGSNGAGIWTVLTGPSPEALRLATDELATEDIWRGVEGRAFTYSREENKVSIQEARRLSFLAPVDTSIANYRLIAANWLSSNLLSYALLIVAASCILGITTATLLRWIGRSK